MLYTVVRNLYTAIKDGTELNTFTSAAALFVGTTHPQPTIRAADMENATNRLWRLRASGIIGCTGTPTFTFDVRLHTTQGTLGGTVIAQSAAITMQSGVSNQSWYLDCDFGVRAAPGSSGTWYLERAEVRSAGGFASPFAYGMWPGGSASDTWTASVTTQSDLYVYIAATCGTSNAANLIKLKAMTLDEVR